MSRTEPTAGYHSLPHPTAAYRTGESEPRGIFWSNLVESGLVDAQIASGFRRLNFPWSMAGIMINNKINKIMITKHGDQGLE